MMYIVRARRKTEGKSFYVTVEPRSDCLSNQFPLGFAWTEALAEAVRFTTSWHAEAIVKALPCGGLVLAVKS